MFCQNTLNLGFKMAHSLSVFEYYKMTQHPQVLLCYRGPVTDAILKEISRDIRSRFADNHRVRRQMFAIYMELAQNIHYYSAEKIHLSNRLDSVGTILLTQSQESYYFFFGNLMEARYLDEMLAKCQYINTLDREALRHYKREQRKAPQKARSRGAGIGLIQVALTSRFPLQIEHRPVDANFSLFSLRVQIAKDTPTEGPSAVSS
ncbi:MAG: SiaB family protein kinase [Microscillaceae bacterium]